MNASQSDKPSFVEHPKVTAYHLQRLAYIYVRQSSLKQVQQNQESQMYQYRLQQRALELGWAKERVRVIDSDLGYSGQDAELRVGFQELVAEISLGHVGIVFGYEVSRLARNNRDWKPFSRNTLKNGFNSNPPDPSGPSSARAIIAGAGIREGGEGNPH